MQEMRCKLHLDALHSHRFCCVVHFIQTFFWKSHYVLSWCIKQTLLSFSRQFSLWLIPCARLSNHAFLSWPSDASLSWMQNTKIPLNPGLEFSFSIRLYKICAKFIFYRQFLLSKSFALGRKVFENSLTLYCFSFLCLKLSFVKSEKYCRALIG